MDHFINTLLYDGNTKLKLQIKNNDQDSSNDGIKGKLGFPFPGRNIVNIQGNLGTRVALSICNSLGYLEATLSLSSEGERSPTFTLYSAATNENFCRNIFSKIIEGQEFSSLEISEIEEQCIRDIGKGHIQIECKKEFTATSSMAAQNACGDGDFCPTDRDSNSWVLVILVFHPAGA